MPIGATVAAIQSQGLQATSYVGSEARTEQEVPAPQASDRVEAGGRESSLASDGVDIVSISEEAAARSEDAASDPEPPAPPDASALAQRVATTYGV